mgnify:CR=1 FL=1
MSKQTPYLMLALIIFACNAVVPPNMNLLTGSVKLKEGNCMPSPETPPCEFEDFQTWVYLTEPSKDFDRGKVVDSVYTDRKGEFEIYLKNGKYSVFVKYKGAYECAGFICNPECSCMPVSLQDYHVNGFRINLDKSYQ